jgi:site-specific DNA-methyltransferase (adenine-specific)/modification methylase
VTEIVKIGDATLYLGDCVDILPTLDKVDAVITDPPYGMGEVLKDKGGRWAGLYTEQNGFAWDKTAPEIVLTFPSIAQKVIIWGGNFFDLPVSKSWLVWNKIIRNFSSSVCELAWTNLDKPINAFDYSHGQLAIEGKQHPTQKPLPLMIWCIEQAGNPNIILDPFMGSGTTGVAAIQMGRKFIGIEREPKYFEIACKRIEQATKQEDMFIAQEKQVQESLAI